jgi:hemerythrin-like domain-containing protein
MADVIDLLRQDHRNHIRLLDVLERQISAAYGVGEPDYDLVGAVVDYFVSYSAKVHHPREDLVFALLRRRDPAAAREVGDLEREHRECEAHLRAFSAAVATVLGTGVMTRQAFSDAALAFIGAQRRHMSREDAVFFPTALRVLSDGDWLVLANAMAGTPDPLFSEAAEARFRRLREAIHRWEAEEGALG